jgi:hypothetical protein
MQAGNFHEKWVAAFNIAAGLLFAGESYWIEIHYWGPDPGYTCDMGCGNCDQFSMIAVEYWDDTFAAIQTHTANGINVYEAAGNGQMNLDNAVYGNRFQRWFRDSGACLIGAGIPGTVAAECWSNYGTRCDLSGWGSAIYAAGYGYIFNPGGDIRQRYTATFGGTSGATPIVVAAGNDLQGIAQGKYGTTLTPAQMRVSLDIGATAWTGTRDIGERPDLVDAINWIEPDVYPYNRAGWYAAVTPRDAGGATPASCPITTYLTGNSTATYWNVSGYNVGYTPAPDATNSQVWSQLYLDSDYIYWFNWTPRIAANSAFEANNYGPYNVRGGRHSVQWYLDPNNDFLEWNENNNSITRQFVWSPYQFAAANSYQVRSAPPLKNWGSPTYQNGDGFRGAATGRWWLGCAVLPQAGNDVDVRSYADSYNSTSGFDTYQKESARGSGGTDLILVNGNVVGYQPTRLFQAIRYSDATTDAYAVEGDESNSDSWYAPYMLNTSLGGNEIMDIYEIYMAAGTQYFVGAINVTNSLDLTLAIYGQGGDYYGYYDYDWISNSQGANGNEYVIITPTESGWYAAVVMKSGSESYGVFGFYTFDFESPGQANMQPSPAQPGWDAPVVARNTADANTGNAVFPAAIQGNVTNYLNTSVENTGTAVAPSGIITKITLDDIRVLSPTTAFTLNPFNYSISNNVNIGPIRGGRHTLGSIVDTSNVVAESNEGDNTWSQQYVWSPLELNRDAAVNRSAPPLHGSGTYWNNDGFSVTTPINISSISAVLSPGSSADYDLYSYSDYSGTSSGFSAYVTGSGYVANQMDYVIYPYTITYGGFTYYPAVVNYNNSADNMFVESDHTLGRISYVDTWSVPDPDTLVAGNLVNIYEFPLTGGTAYAFTCDMLSGSANVGLRLHRSSLGAQGRASAVAAVNSGGNGADEVLTYTPPSSDWYSLVVEKVDAASASQTAIYNLSAGLDQPLPVNNLVIQYWTPPAGSRRLKWTHINTTTNGNPLVGRRYVVYRSNDINLVPMDTDSIGGTTDSTYIDTTVPPLDKYFYRVKVKAN